jgi:hypothetical protein
MPTISSCLHPAYVRFWHQAGKLEGRLKVRYRPTAEIREPPKSPFRRLDPHDSMFLIQATITADGSAPPSLIGVRVVEQSTIQRLGREVKMRPEICRRWGHLGRPPHIPQCSSPASWRSIIAILRCCISSVMTLPGFGTVYRYSGKHQSQSRAEYQDYARMFSWLPSFF